MAGRIKSKRVTAGPRAELPVKRIGRASNSEAGAIWSKISFVIAQLPSAVAMPQIPSADGGR